VLLAGIVPLASTGMCVLVLLFWILRDERGLKLWSGIGPGLATSAWVSGAAALVAILAGLPVAILASRPGAVFGRIVERVTHIGFGLPGIVIALGLAFGALKLRPDWLFEAVYQSWSVVIVAYLILYLPLAIGPMRALLERVPRRVEEAGLSLGRPRWWVWTTVTLPMTRPGVLAGFGLVFLAAIKELPATLLLAPVGAETLATLIWDATENADYAQAAIPGLLVVLLSSGTVALVVRRERLATNDS